jgi:hypothetical protein
MDKKEKYHDITEVLETNDYSFANRHLALGWRLLRLGETSDGQIKRSSYILGWPKPLPAKHPKKKMG